MATVCHTGFPRTSPLQRHLPSLLAGFPGFELPGFPWSITNRATGATFTFLRDGYGKIHQVEVIDRGAGNTLLYRGD